MTLNVLILPIQLPPPPTPSPNINTVKLLNVKLSNVKKMQMHFCEVCNLQCIFKQ